MPSEEQFFTKLGEIPVVNDSWTTAIDYYTRVKDYNRVTNLALGMADWGVKKAAEISTPVINRYQPQINTVNTYACNKLEEIEDKYPLIRQPSEEVKEAALDYVQPVVGRVKPVVTYVQDVYDNGVKQVNRVKTCGTNLVVGARDLGVDTVDKAVTLTFDNPAGRLVTRTVDGIITQADSLVDKYIPGDQEEVDEQSGDGNDDDQGAPEGGDQVEEMELEDPTPQRVVVHFRTVGSKLRNRMFRRAMRDFQGAKVRTVEALEKLQNTVDLIDYAKKNLSSARVKVEDMWGQITEETDQEGENNRTDTVLAGSVEERIVSLGRILARQVRAGMSSLEKASNEAGQFVRHPISKSLEYRDLVYQFSTDLSSVSVESIRTSLASIQKQLQQLIDNVESPEWLQVDIEMEGLGLEEDDLNNYPVEVQGEGDNPGPLTHRPENHVQL